MIAQTATPFTPFLSRAEERQLFTLVWQNASDAQEARETLIHNNLKAVRNFILKQPAFSWYDGEDADQEAYMHLAMALDEVPPSAKNPAGYLYKVACKSLQKSCSFSILSYQSLDAPLPSRETTTTLQDILVVPSTEHVPARPVSVSLTNALHRLPLRQQQALQEFFSLSNFQPQANARRVPRSKATENTDREREARYDAYNELRRDMELRQAVEPLARNWTRTPAKNLKYYRLLHGWSLQDVAKALGVSPNLVWSWEGGTYHPRAAYRAQLCQLYGVPADQLGLKGA